MTNTSKKPNKEEIKSTYFEFKGFLSFLILHELNSKHLAGDELAEKIGRRKGGVLTAGTIYPTLKRLRLKKLIKYKRFGRRKVYQLTDIGRSELDKLYILFSRYFFGLKKRIKRPSK